MPFFGQDFMQQTPAAQHVIRQTLGKGARRVRRKAKKIGKKVRRAARKVKRSAKGAKFVKGSAAARRHMARLRKMRRK